jgi:hypothetical protein
MSHTSGENLRLEVGTSDETPDTDGEGAVSRVINLGTTVGGEGGELPNLDVLANDDKGMKVSEHHSTSSSSGKSQAVGAVIVS